MTMRMAAESIARTLRDAGYEAVFAGGCVRDMLMGREPTDFDVATSAHPDEVMRRFRRTQKVGAKFGVVLVKIGRHTVEVATFRTDLEYEDGRRPVGVQFSSPEEDARRRDFTINGMFIDPFDGHVIDFVGGRADIDARLIRAIGDADRRFGEDHLRLLRAIRFAARFDFEIESRTLEAIRRHAPQLVRIAPERVRVELEKMLTHERRAKAVQLLLDSNLWPHLWSNAAETVDAVAAALPVLTALPPSAEFETSMAALLLNVTPPQVEAFLSGVRCSNSTRITVAWLLKNVTAADDPDRLTMSQLKRLMAAHAYSSWLQLLAARTKAGLVDPHSLKRVLERTAAIPPHAVEPPPLLTGHDLTGMGVPAGPVFKTVLDAAYEAQLNETIASREDALALARRLLADAKSR